MTTSAKPLGIRQAAVHPAVRSSTFLRIGSVRLSRADDGGADRRGRGQQASDLRGFQTGHRTAAAAGQSAASWSMRNSAPRYCAIQGRAGISPACRWKRAASTNSTFNMGKNSASTSTRSIRRSPRYWSATTPRGTAATTSARLARLKRLSEWLHERQRLYMFEMLVPAEQAQLDALGDKASTTPNCGRS